MSKKELPETITYYSVYDLYDEDEVYVDQDEFDEDDLKERIMEDLEEKYGKRPNDVYIDILTSDYEADTEINVDIEWKKPNYSKMYKEHLGYFKDDPRLILTKKVIDKMNSIYKDTIELKDFCYCTTPDRRRLTSVLIMSPKMKFPQGIGWDDDAFDTEPYLLDKEYNVDMYNGKELIFNRLVAGLSKVYLSVQKGRYINGYRI